MRSRRSVSRAIGWARGRRAVDIGVLVLLGAAGYVVTMLSLVSGMLYAVLPFAALVLTRQAPLVVTSAVVVTTSAVGAIGVNNNQGSFGYTAAAMVICSYLAVRFVPERIAAVPVALGAVVALGGGLNLASVAALAGLVGGGAATLQGFASRTAVSEGLVALLRTRAQEQEREQAWLAERASLARELHDIVGHHVTAIVVSAEAAKAQGADKHLAGLDTVAELGRTTLAELDMLVRSLRDDDGTAPTQAIPTLADLPRLMEPLRAAGVAADLTTVVTSRLDEARQLAAYRVVQEATTNILKHAKATAAKVDVVERDGELTVRVTDNGTGDSGRAEVRGRGLIGIGERVDALGGSWSYEPVPGSGTTVTARLPVGKTRR